MFNQIRTTTGFNSPELYILNERRLANTILGF